MSDINIGYSPATWRPTQLGVMGGFWRADNITLTLGKVSTWQDLSNAGNDLTQSVDILQPTQIANTINSKPVVRFVSGTYLTKGSGAGSGASNTWWIVLKATSQAVGPCIGVGATNSIDGSGTDTLEIRGSATLSTTQSIIGSFRTIVWCFNGVSSYIRVNGSEIATGDTGSPGTITDLWIGSTVTNFYAGDIAECGFTRQVLSGTGLIRLENYLRRRYATW